MNRGFYHSANGMILNQRMLNTIANNINNMNTSGFRADKLVTNTFKEQLILVKNRSALSGTFEQKYVENSETSLVQGPLEFTSSKFDVAIDGNVYFNVQTENGNMLTRFGQWELDDEGYLSLGKMGRILGENGAIYVGTSDFAIDNEGNVRTTNGLADKLLLTYIPQDGVVTKFGENLFTYDGDAELPEGEEFHIIQGAYERSNTDINYETLQSIEIQRLFEANSTLLKQADEINAQVASISKI